MLKKGNLYSKRNEKDFDAKKKKYYNLLLEYQEITARDQTFEEKTLTVSSKI
jgi:hypothetical protein